MPLFKNYKLPVSVIGSGNLAWHLLPALENAGYSIKEIYSQTKTNAQKLCDHIYQSVVQTHLDFTESESKIFIVAVRDDAIQEVIKELKIPSGSYICHTSGSVPLDILKKFENYGVFYPTQTFSKSRPIKFSNIPICLEASNEESKKVFSKMADYIGSNYTFLDSKDRKIVHLAAVFASNFTNHLLGISHELLENEQIDFSILKPLIEETINKAFSSPPYQMQTGPALRGDEVTMNSHLQMLYKKLNFVEIYKSISQSIQDKKKQH